MWNRVSNIEGSLTYYIIMDIWELYWVLSSFSTSMMCTSAHVCPTWKFGSSRTFLSLYLYMRAKKCANNLITNKVISLQNCKSRCKYKTHFHKFDGIYTCALCPFTITQLLYMYYAILVQHMLTMMQWLSMWVTFYWLDLLLF